MLSWVLAGLVDINGNDIICLNLRASSGKSIGIFDTAGSERMRIDSSGRLLVGSTVSNGAGAGTIVAGDAVATSGGVALQVKYAADDSIVNYGSQYSSGDALIGHGVASSQTTANTFISTADNAAFARGALLSVMS